MRPEFELSRLDGQTVFKSFNHRKEYAGALGGWSPERTAPLFPPRAGVKPAEAEQAGAGNMGPVQYDLEDLEDLVVSIQNSNLTCRCKMTLTHLHSKKMRKKPRTS